eukprot:Blabericola_migrator_1__12741@NODE_817_length_6395_cov_148_403129_g576_i0_p1_GENE_NODE_817_length_6395_cov_148_403129_g576_i0NODE_817_length_6395_cov_148_403129_g576_i0_p1_ORF_typecomplete_len825_score115_10Oxysterol_BP/PF01237_18/7_8e90PH/PF00169_29/1_3e05PH_4/PF15404_6/0_057PH_4/PF15404_6/2_3PH_13/PF16652_5/0_0013YscOlike/PF16789_5/0_0087SIKE/PF05769_11/0_028CortBP2/PF09727_9/0_04PH_11/PF15413_6/1_8TMF_TATA_bd/PF12325_8/2_7TMF_TATA_bd/PF12325_8/15DUF3450/PF11932_8/3_5e02DUF3450/PF11932_8/0_11P
MEPAVNNLVPPRAALSELIIHEGAVQKSASSYGGYLGGRWNHKWLKLYPGMLQLCSEEGHPREEIPLNLASIKKNKDDFTRFSVLRPSGKPLEFRAKSSIERNLWVKKIIEAKQVYDSQSKQAFVTESDPADDWSDTDTVPLKKLNREVHDFVARNQRQYDELIKIAQRMNELTVLRRRQTEMTTFVSSMRSQITDLLQVVLHPLTSPPLQELTDLKRRHEAFERVYKKGASACDSERHNLQSTIRQLSKENFKLEKQLNKLVEHGKTLGSVQRETSLVTETTDVTPTKGAGVARTSETEAKVSVSQDRDEFFDADEDVEEPTTRDLLPLKDSLMDDPPPSSTSSSSVTDDLLRRGRSPTDEARMREARVSVRADAVGELDDYEVPILGLPRPSYEFRKELPTPRTDFKISYWGLLKDCIGKDLTKVALPVYFNEPTSFLQRAAEDYQYAWLLEKAAESDDSQDALLYTAIFTTTPYASAVGRTYKPFNPLLGETYEITHMGFRMFTEQVQHHPPTTAYNTTGKGFEAWGHLTINTKFTGKSLEIGLIGPSNIMLNNQCLLSFQRARMVLNNVIFGKITFDMTGTYTITNHTTGEYALVDFPRRSGWWRSDPPHQVRGLTCDRHGCVTRVFSGMWSSEIVAFRPLRQMTLTPCVEADSPVPPRLLYQSKAIDFEVDWNSLLSPAPDCAPKVMWRCEQRPPHSSKYYEFGAMTFELNDLNELYDRNLGAPVPPTDSRYRPDQRALEWGHVEESIQEKLRLEEKQRARIRALPHGELKYEPSWFKRCMDPILKVPAYQFQKEYWDSKLLEQREDIDAFFSRCPDIF